MYTHALYASCATFIFYYKGDQHTSECILRAFCTAHTLLILPLVHFCAVAPHNDVGFHIGLESSLEKSPRVLAEFFLFYFFF